MNTKTVCCFLFFKMRPEAPSFVDIETFEKKAVTQKGANFLDFS